MKDHSDPASPEPLRYGTLVPTPRGGDAPLTKVPQPGTPVTRGSVEKLREALRDGRIPKVPKR